jgi:hypothetical protein
MAAPEWVGLRDRLDQRVHKKWDRFSWVTLRALLSSWNDILGKGAPRLVHDLRGRWVAAQRQANGDWSDDLVIPMTDATSFLVIGDPGEQDASQYVVVSPLLTQEDADFMVVLSDVIYPAGDVNDYVDGFYVPYQDFKNPIFAIPGNHDWYDGLNGFMWNFCGADPLPPTAYASTGYSARERLARRLWRRASAPDRDRLNAWRTDRVTDGKRWRPLQPGPYWAIETADLLLVGIDTGIKGDELDREQADWLVRVSRSSDKPKVLLTGKPLLVDFELHPCKLAGSEEDPDRPYEYVHDLVLDPELGYVAAIGGDIHNYQYYRAHSDFRSRMDYFVSGGAGAYMSATHTIRPHDGAHFAEDYDPLPGTLTVDEFDCYPKREQSLAFYGKQFVPRIWRIVLGLLATALGYGLGVAAVFAVDLDDDTLEIALAVAAGIVAVAGFALATGLGAPTRSEDAKTWRSAAGLLLGLLFGTVLALAGWWLTEDRFERVAWVAAALVAGGGLIAWILRKLGRWAWASLAAQVVAYGLQTAGVLALVAFVAVPDHARGVVGALILAAVAPALVVLLNLAVRRISEELRRFSVPIGLVLSALAALVLVRQVEGGDESRAVATLYATLVFLVAVPLLLDYSRRVLHPAAQILMTGLVLAAVVAALAVFADDTWATEAAVAAAALLSLLVIGVAVAHLSFLGAFTLVWRGDARCKELTVDEARDALPWRDASGTKPKDARVRTIVDLVHPGTNNPRGPLQSKVSEVFDNDKPPFHKSFLRLDVENGKLVVRCFGVTGDEKKPEDVEVVDTVEIPLPPRAPASS